MWSIRMLAVAGVAVAFTGLGPALAASASAAPAARQWVASVPGPAGDGAIGYATAASPDGKTVYAAGVAGTGEAVAYDAATGAVRWKYRVSNGPGSVLQAVAVSPDGSTVFVTGYKEDYSPPQQVIVALNAASGAKLWKVTGSGDTFAGVSPAVVSPDSSTLYVTGSETSQTAAYNAATGAVLWTAPSGGYALALSPDGATLFVTGVWHPSFGPTDSEAFNAATGAKLWRSGPVAGFPTAVAVSHDGTILFATGWQKRNGGGRMITAAYDTASGAQLWTVTTRINTATVAGLVTTASTVIVTANVGNAKSTTPYWQSVAYNPATGAIEWTRAQHVTGGTADATALALSPDSSTVYVTGVAFSSSRRASTLTVGYNTTTGKPVWTARYAQDSSGANAITVSPDGSQVFTIGESTPSGSQQSVMTTIAYSTS